MIVFVDLADFSLKQMPADVVVLTRRRLVVWLTSLRPAYDAATVEAVYAQARLGATWR